MCCLKCSKLCVESPRAKRWSGVSSRSDGAGKLYRGMQFTVAERGSVGEQNAETKGRKGVRQRETPSHTAVPEVQMAYSACHPSSLFQGYHRSNHFIATQGEYPSKAVVFMCMCVCMCACRAVNTFLWECNKLKMIQPLSLFMYSPMSKPSLWQIQRWSCDYHSVKGCAGDVTELIIRRGE